MCLHEITVKIVGLDRSQRTIGNKLLKKIVYLHRWMDQRARKGVDGIKGHKKGRSYAC